MQWIDRYGLVDGDGFVEYARRSPKGLVHQGWKDSKHAVFHVDGTLADGPIALAEVQGYGYAAKRGAAEMAAMLGDIARAQDLMRQAYSLQERFTEAFWYAELATYSLALDGQKRPCRVRTSDVGHCLFSEIASAPHAERPAYTLMEDKVFSGWGIRTVAASRVRFNPMSYHNGSVWPHDNALTAYGLSHYGLREPVLKILAGLFDASLFIELHRMPELFCGFPRRPGEGPTLYPAACAPRSWAAATVCLLLQGCLGLSGRAHLPQITFSYPLLPPFLQEVRIKNLQVRQASVGLVIRCQVHDVSANIERRQGKVEILNVK